MGIAAMTRRPAGDFDQGGALDPAQPARDEASLTGTALGKLTSTSVSPVAAGAEILLLPLLTVGLGFLPADATDAEKAQSAIDGIVADWIGSGNRLLSAEAFGNSGTSGGGNLDTSVQTWANGTLTVVYDYTVPAPAQIPEPASMALIGLGALGLAAVRRRK